MQKSSLLMMLTCSMAVLLIAGRCSSDDDKAAAGGMSGAKESAPLDSSKTEQTETVDSGVETDPLGHTIGGQDDMTAPMEDLGADAVGDDIGLDDPTSEPEPVPEEAADL